MESQKQQVISTPTHQHFLEPLGNEADTLFEHLSVDVACLAFCALVWGVCKLWNGRLRKRSKVATKVTEPAPTKPAPKVPTAGVNPLDELLSLSDRQRGRTLELYHKYRSHLDWTSLAPLDAEKGFFNLCMAAARQGDMAALTMLLQDMDKAEVPRTANLYTNLCKMITAKRLFPEALSLWRWMRKDQAASGLEIDRSTWSCLLFAATQAKENDLALNFFEHLHQTGSANPADYGNACRVLVSTSRAREAALLVREMHENNIEPYRVTYQMVFSACCADGHHLDLAMEMIPHMRRLPVLSDQENIMLCDSVMYNVLIKGHCVANRFDEAFGLFAAMKEDDCTPSSITFGILLDASIEAGYMDKASQVFEQMRSIGIEMNAVLFTTMIKGFAKAGKVKEALQLYETMLSQGVQPDLFTYSTLIKVLCDNKELQSAFLLIEEMGKQGVSPDEVVFNNLLAGCIHCANLPLGEQLVQDMMKSGIYPSVTTMSILMKLYSRCQEYPKALELLQSMKAQFGVSPERRLYVQLVNTFLSVRKGALVMETLHAMRDLFGMPSAVEVTKFLRLGVQFRLLDVSVQILSLSLNDGVPLEDDALNGVMEAACKGHHKAAMISLTDLAHKYNLRLRSPSR